MTELLLPWVPVFVQIVIGVLTLVGLTVKLGERQKYLEHRLETVVTSLHDDNAGYMPRAELGAKFKAINDKIDSITPSVVETAVTQAVVEQILDRLAKIVPAQAERVRLDTPDR